MSAFDESKHRRGQPGNPGQFAAKPEGSATDTARASALAAATAVLDGTTDDTAAAPADSRVEEARAEARQAEEAWRSRRLPEPVRAAIDDVNAAEEYVIWASEVSEEDAEDAEQAFRETLNAAQREMFRHGKPWVPGTSARANAETVRTAIAGHRADVRWVDEDGVARSVVGEVRAVVEGDSWAFPASADGSERVWVTSAGAEHAVPISRVTSVTRSQ